MPSPSIWLQKQAEASLGFTHLVKCPNLQVTWEDNDEEDKEEEESPFLAALWFSPLAPFNITHLQKNRWLSQMGICSEFHCSEKKCILCWSKPIYFLHLGRWAAKTKQPNSQTAGLPWSLLGDKLLRSLNTGIWGKLWGFWFLPLCRTEPWSSQPQAVQGKVPESPMALSQPPWEAGGDQAAFLWRPSHDRPSRKQMVGFSYSASQNLWSPFMCSTR